MSEHALAALGLPAIDQVGFVVKDINKAIASYDALFGPFTTMDAVVPAAQYRGREADCELKLAFGRSGDVEIELIQWVSGESPHREFIEAGREGMQHLRFRVDDADAWIAKLAPEGYRPIWYKRWSEDTVFSYLERDDDALLVEILQMP